MIKNLGKVMQMVAPVIPAVVGGMQILAHHERSQATQASAAVDIAQAQASEHINAINADVAAYLGNVDATVNAINADAATYIADTIATTNMVDYAGAAEMTDAIASVDAVNELANLANTDEGVNALSSLLDSILNW
jgi:hypothetical protein